MRQRCGRLQCADWTWNQTQGYLGDVHTIPTSSSGGNQVASWEFRDLPNGYIASGRRSPAADNRPTSVTYTVLDDQDSRGTHAANQRTAPNDLYADSVWWKELGDADIMNGMLRVSVKPRVTGERRGGRRDPHPADQQSDVDRQFTIDDRTPDGRRFQPRGERVDGGHGWLRQRLRTNAAGSGADKARLDLQRFAGLVSRVGHWYPTLGNSGAADAPFTVFDDQTPRGTMNRSTGTWMPNDSTTGSSGGNRSAGPMRSRRSARTGWSSN